MTAYYNEHDANAAAWLRELIKAGAIAPGEVDERSIEDVAPGDLQGFTQCHFFAGIGVWSYALREAGWSDERPVWTGSCPCQPFSAAGKGLGFDDERHLWPAFHWLIQECRPATVFGEQVASKAVNAWIDLVHADLEALGYAFGSIPFPSAGVGAPHIRDRTYWVADAAGARSFPGALPRVHSREEGARAWDGESERYGAVGGLADTDVKVQGGRGILRPGESTGASAGAACERSSGLCQVESGQPGPTNGLWRDLDWLLCRDGKWRPVEPGTRPLADGAPARMGRLRGYGNAVNAEAAKVWIETVKECLL